MMASLLALPALVFLILALWSLERLVKLPFRPEQNGINCVKVDRFRSVKKRWRYLTRGPSIIRHQYKKVKY